MVAVILAAGLGTRMKSRLPKVLHPILGDPSLLWVLRSLPPRVSRALVVVHHGKDRVQAALAGWEAGGLLPCPVQAVDQGEPLGTGHALQACIPSLDGCGAERVLILSGDVPLLPSGRVEALLDRPAALLAMELENPGSYGRVLLGAAGTLQGIVEARDLPSGLPEQRLVNGGAYHLPWEGLRQALGRLKAANAQGEYYLTDAVTDLAASLPVEVLRGDASELAGMNSRRDQAALEALAAERINMAWMDEGVSFLDPGSARIGPRVSLASDVTVEAGVRVEGASAISAGCVLGQGCVLRDCRIGGDTVLRPYSVLEGAEIGEGCVVGPFARLREGTRMAPGSHVGNFVETKQARLGPGVKANHLSYLGDCEVGEGTNVGAGVITCNYDGFRKHRTVIGKGVFIGSDSQLVAPVTLGDGAIVGAGTTVTEDVPADALALARAPLTLKDGAAGRLRARLRSRMG
ncbi:MAG: bifunctional UDP-N-acetylglucosamine diphosphorylase/glucosamine-1-phosphate N-acetyltransferase GlmU [Acidobacteria bacterium]|nr:bifunctional UDP-N-acetylglucosamine diphosphorylase/glucosamine-1-phosphate N-acetyltransferase GlmU [Acidobacteriota bacterium]